jgi:hypothetical protein
MVEYLKTKKGYFYKLKKMVKKRISREEFSKKNKTRKNKTRKNKTRKNKKMIGGWRSRDHIIKELRDKGKYDEWIRHGARFGQIRYNVIKEGEEEEETEEVLSAIPSYMFYDVDGNIVKVSTTATEYNPELYNIAVFNRDYVDPTNVDQSKYRIVNVSESLSTTGLATCTGLAMIIGTKKFMTHLDATTPIDPIISAIDQIIATEGIAAGSLNPIIYAGCLDSSLTLQKAKEICSTVGIPETNYNIIKDVDMMNRVRI